MLSSSLTWPNLTFNSGREKRKLGQPDPARTGVTQSAL